MNIKSRKGYTLIELLVVIAIIAVLASISIPIIAGVTRRVQLNSDNTNALNYSSSISIWQSEPPSDAVVYYQNLSTSNLFGSMSQIDYTDKYMGTKQLPGVEFVTQNDIRNATILAIESVAKENIQPDASGNYYLPHPETSGYGYKYYYRVGKVTVEKVDIAHTMSTDEAYKYWIWLDNQPGATISICSTPITKYERIIGATSSNVAKPTFSFLFSIPASEDVDKCVFTVENEGCSYTLSGKNKTAQVFVPGTFNIKYYYSGELKADSSFVVRDMNVQSGIVTISFDGSSSMQLSSNKNDFVFNGTTVTKYNGSDEVVVVPTTNHAGAKITTIGPDAFKNSTAKRIIVPDTVVQIQSRAFSFCNNLTYLALPSPHLSTDAIIQCPKLDTIEFYVPNTVNILDASVLLTNMREIQYGAIHNCRKLMRVELTTLYRNINVGAFEQMKTENANLAVIVDATQNDMRTNIASKSYVSFNYTPLDMFMEPSANTIYLSQSAPALYTDGTKTLAMPHIVTVSGSVAKKFNSVASPTQAQANNVVTLKNKYENFVLAEGYTAVGANAFKTFTFSTISLPSTLKTIGADAFNGNKCLSIEIPSSVESIGARAFASETLETIVIRGSLSAFNTNSLKGCNRVRTILIYDYEGDKSAVTGATFGLSNDVAIVFA